MEVEGNCPRAARQNKKGQGANTNTELTFVGGSVEQTTNNAWKVRVPPQSTGRGVPTANQDPCQCIWLLPHTVNLFRSTGSNSQAFPACEVGMSDFSTSRHYGDPRGSDGSR